MCNIPPPLPAAYMAYHLNSETLSNPSPPRFMAFHPPAFLMKLNIEMSMGDLILKIAKSEEFTSLFTGTTGSFELSYYAESNADDNYNHNSIDDDDTVKLAVARTRDPEAGLETGSQTSLAISGDRILGSENGEHSDEIWRS